MPIQIEPAPLTPPPPSLPADATPAWEIVTARGHVLRVHRGIPAAELGAVLAALGLTEPPR